MIFDKLMKPFLTENNKTFSSAKPCFRPMTTFAKMKVLPP